MSRSLYRLAGALAAAAVASQTAAQAPQPSPYAPPPSPGGATITATPPAPPFRPRFYLGMGYDIGGAKVFQVPLSDGSTPSLNANGGLFLNAGGDFLPLADGLLHTRATIGLRLKMISAKDGDVTYMAFPFEAVEFLNFAPVRIGAGVNLCLGPSIKGSGVASVLQFRSMPNVMGFTVQGEYEFRGAGRSSGVVLGVRYLVQKVKFEGISAVDGNSFGIYLGWLP